MCQKAAETAAAVLKGVEPTFVELLTLEGIATTTEGVTAINAFNAAQAALASWQSGTPAQNIIQLVDDFTAVFGTLPLPPEVKSLGNIILAALATVTGILSANSPAPASPAGAPAFEETQALHALSVRADTEAKVQALVPQFKLSRFHSPAVQYRNTWNKAVEDLGDKYSVLKQ